VSDLNFSDVIGNAAAIRDLRSEYPSNAKAQAAYMENLFDTLGEGLTRAQKDLAFDRFIDRWTDNVRGVDFTARRMEVARNLRECAEAGPVSAESVDF